MKGEEKSKIHVKTTFCLIIHLSLMAFPPFIVLLLPNYHRISKKNWTAEKSTISVLKMEQFGLIVHLRIQIMQAE